MADFSKFKVNSTTYNVKDANAGKSLAVSGSDLQLKNAAGTAISTVTLPGGFSMSGTTASIGYFDASSNMYGNYNSHLTDNGTMLANADINLSSVVPIYVEYDDTNSYAHLCLPRSYRGTITYGGFSVNAGIPLADAIWCALFQTGCDGCDLYIDFDIPVSGKVLRVHLVIANGTITTNTGSLVTL